MAALALTHREAARHYALASHVTDAEARQAIARHASDASIPGQWRRFTFVSSSERTAIVCSACGCEDCDDHIDAPMEPVTLWRHVAPTLAPSAVTPAHVLEVQAWIASVLQDRGWLTTTEQAVANACADVADAQARGFVRWTIEGNGARERVAEAWTALQRGRRRA